ncbi:hypothetical protein PGTUg99_000509 [Puccinia graminis f. sp. tritici]|uniref:Uncharacterized protein n=1 Tax=Puccinia graminis f. sp. tritici TaxID=56615 RepID=A0A5B0P7X2_PUCGR|nr:hypothetical protein PGTUg99_000509 [Puccinia graminis f. sp. tritici]
MPSLSRLTRSYEQAFKHHPSLTLAITTDVSSVSATSWPSILPAFSDLIHAHGERGCIGYNPPRQGRPEATDIISV